mmetsp:Transcript_85735/g.239705  ORF Transcript_85735/g.239705 Transcript_85735/m.239705 type:complete len:479 (-) Transcript_85735:656-2092(-)
MPDVSSALRRTRAARASPNSAPSSRASRHASSAESSSSATMSWPPLAAAIPELEALSSIWSVASCCRIAAVRASTWWSSAVTRRILASSPSAAPGAPPARPASVLPVRRCAERSSPSLLASWPCTRALDTSSACTSIAASFARTTSMSRSTSACVSSARIACNEASAIAALCVGVMEMPPADPCPSMYWARCSLRRTAATSEVRAFMRAAECPAKTSRDCWASSTAEASRRADASAAMRRRVARMVLSSALRAAVSAVVKRARRPSNASRSAVARASSDAISLSRLPHCRRQFFISSARSRASRPNSSALASSSERSQTRVEICICRAETSASWSTSRESLLWTCVSSLATSSSAISILVSSAETIALSPIPPPLVPLRPMEEALPSILTSSSSVRTKVSSSRAAASMMSARLLSCSFSTSSSCLEGSAPPDSDEGAAASAGCARQRGPTPPGVPTPEVPAAQGWGAGVTDVSSNRTP